MQIVVSQGWMLQPDPGREPARASRAAGRVFRAIWKGADAGGSANKRHHTTTRDMTSLRALASALTGAVHTSVGPLSLNLQSPAEGG